MDIDIIFLSYDEPNADDNWHKLKDRYPHAKRVHGIKGIWEAHCECAKVSRSDHFFLVDGDNEILPEFDFELKLTSLLSRLRFQFSATESLESAVFERFFIFVV